jgi:hypothetical protein
MGVYRIKNTFYSMIVAKNKRTYLGSFKTAEDAHNAYLKAIKKYHGT